MDYFAILFILLGILLHCKMIKYLLFHCCPKTTDASRLALEDYIANNSNQKFQHLTWSIY